MLPPISNNVFLVLTDSLDESKVELYRQISEASTLLGDTFILFHNKREDVKQCISKSNVYEFTNTVLYELGYQPIEDKLVPGSNHFPVLKFFLDHPNYEFYWCVEDDVVFNGSWSYLFNTVSINFNHDLVTGYIQFYKNEPEWKWWKSLIGPGDDLDKNVLLKAFNPIYRISNRALKLIDNELKSGWSGHHEVLMPTLLAIHGYPIADFGGDGDFTPHDFRNKFYTPETLRWRPVFTSPGELLNKIYHPVKRKKTSLRYYKISFCIICMNRLDQLRQTLLQNINDNTNYDSLEFILLDYNSQDEMGLWVKTEMQQYLDEGRIIYYKTNQPERFNHSHAKNLAFKLASGDIVCNINADHFTGKGFAAYVNEQFNQDDKIVITPLASQPAIGNTAPKDVFGKVCVKKADFLTIRGFDERMQTYGFEDFDFINRLEMIGINRLKLQRSDYLQFISHTDLQRFSLEDTYHDLSRILIRYISPSVSNLIFMYHTGRIEMGQIIDNTTVGSDNPEFGYQQRAYEFQYSVANSNWIEGAWSIADAEGKMWLHADGNERFELVPQDRCFTAVLNGEHAIFYVVQNSDVRKQLLDFHYLFKNRRLLEHNILKLVLYPNSNAFGQAIVFKNFDTEMPININ